MLTVVLRKMLNNRWMVLCLLIGSILAVAMVSSIPIYINGILQRMLTRDLEQHQVSSATYTGNYYITSNLTSTYNGSDKAKAYKVFNNKIRGMVEDEIGLPVISKVQDVTMDYLLVLPETKSEKDTDAKYAKVRAFSDIQNHIKITQGHMFSLKKEDGVYETIATQNTMKDLDLKLGETYTVNDFTESLKEPFKVKIVGVFTIKDSRDTYWFQGATDYEHESLFMDYDLFYKDFIEKDTPLLTHTGWYYAFDYHKINLDNISSILKANERITQQFSKYKYAISLKFLPVSILETYFERQNQLKLTLWVLIVPILLMLALYIFMVSRLIINREENEIAVLKSRGASKIQVLLSYLLEGSILGGIALVAGPPVGLLLCTLIGSSNGFLEFVQRTALPISLSGKVYQYAVLAFILIVITMLIPAMISSRSTIIEHKQKKSRALKAPFWRKNFIDIIVLAAAGYGLFRYNSQQKMLAVTGAKGTEIGIDPLLFLISTFFILGAGLLFLRVFPYIVRLVFQLGRKIWSPVFYSSFITVGRSGGQEQFLMLFIILALSIGIFSANAARTINSNIEDKIRYETGADITLKARWEGKRVNIGSPMPGPNGMPEVVEAGPIKYTEPPFEPYTLLSGVEKATKVFVGKDARVEIGGEYISNIRIMGIIPNEFGRVAWFRSDLLPYHWYKYLNLMVKAPKAVLMSRSFQEKYKAKVGDSVYITWGGQGYLECTIYGFIDYWPSFNPNLKLDEGDGSNFIVANLPYMHDMLAMEPYEVWIKKSGGASDTEIYNDMNNKKLPILTINFAKQQLIQKKNDPMVQGTNGALTLGFIVTMTVSTIGFLIYWILSIQGRVLQFGIFRAMGLSVRKVIGMLLCEQVLISGTAILAGILIGGVASELFVPLFQLIYSSAEQVPPFNVIASGSDYIKIYSIVTIMLVIGFTVLGRIVSGIKIDQAIKLGED